MQKELTAALDRFERRERSHLQAYIAAALVAELREAIAAHEAAQPDKDAEIAALKAAQWDEPRIHKLAADMALAVAKNASTAPQLCFPDIYLSLKRELLA